MKILRIFIFMILSLQSISNADDSLNVKFLDLNYILINSLEGKKIIKKIKESNNILFEKHSKIQKKLENDKNEILSQQNILEKDIYNEKVTIHQRNIEKFQKDKQSDLNKINDFKTEETNKLLKNIDRILLEYTKENDINLIFKKESLIVSNINLDITKIILENLNNDFKNNN